MTTIKIIKNSLPACLLLATVLIGCKQPAVKLPTNVELATSWADMTNYITKNTPANSPTFASRGFGYIGLTMYEAVVNGFPNYQSIAPQLNGLGSLPLPQKGLAYHWPLVLNAAEAAILRSIYVQTSAENIARIDSLEKYFEGAFQQQLKDTGLINRSSNYGKLIAGLIFDWSKTDGGHRGYLHNFDKALVIQQKPGCWQPPLYAQSFSHFPLHPHWGSNRTFIAADSTLTAPVCIAFDTTIGSPYYQQFLKVYQKKHQLTQDEKEAAIWWSDDPDVTFTPPGHSYYIASIAIKKLQPDLITIAQTYARVGMAVADAFRNCWKWKYQFYTERANTFVPQHIDQHWESFWPDPPFPAFPSGHAIQAAAAATVLADLYGNQFVFTDSAHAGRPKDEIRNTEFKPRHFNSFWEVAVETANSRFYGGIHIPQDNERGLEKGKEIANNINQLHWKK
jgi:hypothetical protein